MLNIMMLRGVGIKMRELKESERKGKGEEGNKTIRGRGRKLL